MQIDVHGNNLTQDFAKWMLDILKSNLNSNLDKKKLGNCIEHLFSDIHTNLSIEVLWKKCLDALIYQIIDDTFIIIRFNPNLYIVNNIKVETLVKLINFGDLEHKGYPIFTETFTSIASEISDYVTLYKLMEGDST